jgi:hypothetical protein
MQKWKAWLNGVHIAAKKPLEYLTLGKDRFGKDAYFTMQQDARKFVPGKYPDNTTIGA